MKLNYGRHSVSSLHVHLVFVVKYRKGLFTKEVLDYMESVFKNVCSDLEAELVEFDGEKDHVHLLVIYPPKHSISKLVNHLKGVSSRMVRKHGFKTIEKNCWGDALWSHSYFAGSCGGAPIEIVRQYIEQQNTPI